MVLEDLQRRLFGARLYDTNLYNSKGQRIQRLFIRYGINNHNYKTSAWFEVVNDRLTVFVKVESRNSYKGQGFQSDLAKRYKKDIEKQFFEIINDCELKRLKIPLHERLKDDIPPIYDDKSLLHQAQALNFMCSMKVSALFADPGVGKSKPVINLCESRFEAGQIKKAIVFCPVSIIENWKEQLALWWSCKGLEWKIVGTESMSSSPNTIFEAFDYIDSETQVIIDESHMVKDPFAKRSKRILCCASKTSFKVIMTGTPTEHLKDLFMQYAMLSDLITRCNSYFRFEEQFLIMGGTTGDEVIGYKNLDYLIGLLEPYTLQLKLEECLDIPAKVFSEVECDLNLRQQELYEWQKESLIRIIAKDEAIPLNTIFGYLTRMQQIVCGFYKNSYTGEVEDLGTEKLKMLYQTGYEQGQSIFFCKYLYEVDILTDFLGIENCALFTGNNRKTRNCEKELFQMQEKKYFVGTMGSGGVGLNGLQCCHRLIFFSNSFKRIQRRQCIARVERLGQQKKMAIWDMFTVAGIDTKIRKNVEKKEDLANEIRELLHDKSRLRQFVEEL
jgi:SNF2 family DNA or RNA helicase